MNMRLALANDEPLWVIDNSSQPIICISQETVEKIRDFKTSHPDISQDFIDREVNATLTEMVYRMSREINSDA